jgi:hypothetical protein
VLLDGDTIKATRMHSVSSDLFSEPELHNVITRLRAGALLDSELYTARALIAAKAELTAELTGGPKAGAVPSVSMQPGMQSGMQSDMQSGKQAAVVPSTMAEQRTSATRLLSATIADGLPFVADRVRGDVAERVRGDVADRVRGDGPHERDAYAGGTQQIAPTPRAPHAAKPPTPGHQPLPTPADQPLPTPADRPRTLNRLLSAIAERVDRPGAATEEELAEMSLEEAAAAATAAAEEGAAAFAGALALLRGEGEEAKGETAAKGEAAAKREAAAKGETGGKGETAGAGADDAISGGWLENFVWVG